MRFRTVLAASRTREEARSFADLYESDFDRVVRLVWSVTGDWHAAEDATQTAFLKARDRWGSLHRQHPAAWIRVVAINAARSARRRRRRDVVAEIAIAAPMPFPDELVDLITAIRRLPLQQRIAVALYYLEDLALEDVARAMRCAPLTVKTHLQRARKTLTRLVGGA